MSCGCKTDSASGVINRVREKQVEDVKFDGFSYELVCSCGTVVEMDQHLVHCPTCEMTFAVTPCKSNDINNIVMLQEK